MARVVSFKMGTKVEFDPIRWLDISWFNYVLGLEITERATHLLSVYLQDFHYFPSLLTTFLVCPGF